MRDPILVTLLKSHPIIVNLVVKMRSHSSAHLLRKYVVANLVPRSPAVSVKQSEIWVRDYVVA